MLLRIDFNIGWLKKKSDEGVRVVRLVEKWVASAGMACVKTSAPDSVVVEIEPSRRADFEGALAKKFADDFDVKDISKFVSCSVLSDKNRPKSAGAGKNAAKARPPAESRRCEPEPAKPEKNSIDELLDSVPFRYSRELAAYMRETDAVIPMLKKLDSVASFWRRSLLLSIDDGYGLTDFLRTLGRLYGIHGIAKKENHRDDMCVIMSGCADEMATMLGGQHIGESLSVPLMMFERYGDGIAALVLGFSDAETEINKAEASDPDKEEGEALDPRRRGIERSGRNYGIMSLSKGWLEGSQASRKGSGNRDNVK